MDDRSPGRPEPAGRPDLPDPPELPELPELPDDPVGQALASLGDYRPGGSWPEGATLRRRGDRRRRRRRLTAAGCTTAVVLAVAVLLISEGTGPHPNPSANSRPALAPGQFVRTTLGSAEEIVSTTARAAPPSGRSGTAATAEQSFSLAVLRQSVESAGSTNVVDSPYSLAEALLMLELGARGTTASQIGNTLGMAGMAPGQQADAWASLSTDLQRAATADHVALQDADSLWAQPALSLVPSYLTSLKQTFDAGLWRTDFSGHPAASVAAINAWVSRETHGKITRLLSTGDVDPSTVLALLNAVYFKAPWQAPLSDLPQAGFRAPGGDVTVPYLGNGGSGSLKASVGDGVEEVELPYWNGVPATDQHSRAAGGPGRYAADIIMPTAESLPRFVDTLDAGTWRAMLGRLSSQAVDLSFPKFSLAANRDLSQNLKALGITDAFSSQAADLSGISPIPTYVKLVRQAATLDVTKWGTVATAATAVVADATAARRSIAVHIDRPFLFVIRDTMTGAILFTAAVTDPSA